MASVHDICSDLTVATGNHLALAGPGGLEFFKWDCNVQIALFSSYADCHGFTSP
jgi:hypothetical protein